jgi:hypothetical protein
MILIGITPKEKYLEAYSISNPKAATGLCLYWPQSAKSYL